MSGHLFAGQADHRKENSTVAHPTNASMRYGTLQLPPYRIFVSICVALSAIVSERHYSDTSMLYASNKSTLAEAPPLQNLCHGLASSAMVFNYDQRH